MGGRRRLSKHGDGRDRRVVIHLALVRVALVAGTVALVSSLAAASLSAGATRCSALLGNGRLVYANAAVRVISITKLIRSETGVRFPQYTYYGCASKKPRRVTLGVAGPREPDTEGTDVTFGHFSSAGNVVAFSDDEYERGSMSQSRAILAYDLARAKRFDTRPIGCAKDDGLEVVAFAVGGRGIVAWTLRCFGADAATSTGVVDAVSTTAGPRTLVAGPDVDTSAVAVLGDNTVVWRQGDQLHGASAG